MDGRENCIYTEQSMQGTGTWRSERMTPVIFTSYQFNSGSRLRLQFWRTSVSTAWPTGWQSAIAKGRYRKSRYCHIMYKLLYPSIRVRIALPVSVRVRVRVSVSFSFTVLHVYRGLLRQRTFAIADLCDSGPESPTVPSDVLWAGVNTHHTASSICSLCSTDCSTYDNKLPRP